MRGLSTASFIDGQMIPEPPHCTLGKKEEKGGGGGGGGCVHQLPDRDDGHEKGIQEGVAYAAGNPFGGAPALGVACAQPAIQIGSDDQRDQALWGHAPLHLQFGPHR